MRTLTTRTLGGAIEILFLCQLIAALSESGPMQVRIPDRTHTIEAEWCSRILDSHRKQHLGVVHWEHHACARAEPTTSNWRRGRFCRRPRLLRHHCNMQKQIVGSTITGLLAVACGWVGEKHHIGYTVSSRFSWGMYGSYFPVLLRIFVGAIWLGLQAFWGGQSTRVLIGAVIPGTS